MNFHVGWKAQKDDINTSQINKNIIYIYIYITTYWPSSSSASYGFTCCGSRVGSARVRGEGSQQREI